MNPRSLRLLTWVPLVAAMAGAMWLSNAESALPDSKELDDVLTALVSEGSMNSALGRVLPVTDLRP